MTIDALPTPPQPSDSKETFNTRMFAFLAAMVSFVTQTNATATEVDADAAAAAASKNAALSSQNAAAASQLAAASSATAAAASAGATAWNPATNYSVGQRAWSLIDAQLYRRIVAGTTATDPRNDQTNWARVWVEPEMVTAESLFF